MSLRAGVAALVDTGAAGAFFPPRPSNRLSKAACPVAMFPSETALSTSAVFSWASVKDLGSSACPWRASFSSLSFFMGVSGTHIQPLVSMARMYPRGQGGVGGGGMSESACAPEIGINRLNISIQLP
ncbi:MAG: hypothetical protein A2V88_05955 [Elusimicrobia bacterium RBG_16_66_12]|nr:MAG: hypothetical protein A2V88_05955 [Elusimicrobia bacterium RBG_16_66_12]